MTSVMRPLPRPGSRCDNGPVSTADEGPVGTADDGPGTGGLRRFTWWSLAGATVAFMVPVLAPRLWAPGASPWATAAGLLGLAAVSACLMALFGRRLARGTDGPFPAAWVGAGCAGALAAALVLWPRGDGLWSVAPAVMAAPAAMFLSPRRGWVLVAAVAAALAVPGLLRGSDAFGVLFPPGLALVVAWTVLGLLWTWDVAARLDESRRLAARLAIARERLRFAAELHDVQGHHLQVIALKAQLAARLAEADPARAAGEMREVAGLAADALRDTRAVVRGYRRTSPEREAANAARVLESAGIRVRSAVEDVEGGTGAARELLGLAVREATTNVLRHSRAGEVEISLRRDGGDVRLLVANDGAAPAAGGDGTGLRSLAERVGAAGGTLAWENEDGRFTVAVALPWEGGR